MKRFVRLLCGFGGRNIINIIGAVAPHAVTFYLEQLWIISNGVFSVYHVVTVLKFT